VDTNPSTVEFTEGDIAVGTTTAVVPRGVTEVEVAEDEGAAGSAIVQDAGLGVDAVSLLWLLLLPALLNDDRYAPLVVPVVGDCDSGSRVVVAFPRPLLPLLRRS